MADSNVRTLEALAGDVGAMYERELVPKNELLAVQVALADARQNRLRAANRAEIAQAAYNRRLGEPLDRVAESEEQVPEPDSLPAEVADHCRKRLPKFKVPESLVVVDAVPKSGIDKPDRAESLRLFER